MVSGNCWGNWIKVYHALCDLSFNHTWISEVTQERICKFKLPSWQTKLFLLLQNSFFSPNSLISNPEKENICPSSPQLSQQQQTPEACMYPASLWTPTIVSLSLSTWVHQAQAQHSVLKLHSCLQDQPLFLRTVQRVTKTQIEIRGRVHVSSSTHCWTCLLKTELCTVPPVPSLHHWAHSSSFYIKITFGHLSLTIS